MMAALQLATVRRVIVSESTSNNGREVRSSESLAVQHLGDSMVAAQAPKRPGVTVNGVYRCSLAIRNATVFKDMHFTPRTTT